MPLIRAKALSWTGDSFEAVDPALVTLPRGDRLSGAGVAIDADVLRRVGDLVRRINPRIRAFISADRTAYVGDNDEDAALFRSCEDKGCVYQSDSKRDTVWLNGADKYQYDIVDTAAHELLHSVVYNLVSIDHKTKSLDWSNIELLEAHGNLLRRDNNADERYYKPWFDKEEEAEAVAFASWATGRTAPFGIEPSKDVLKLFRAIRNGEYANHKTSSALWD